MPDSLHSLRLIINQIKYHAILVRILFKLDPRFDFLRKKRNSLNQKTMTDSQNLLLINGCFTIIFSPSTKKIFFKTEFLTVIFRGLTNLNLYWFKSYDTNAKKVTNDFFFTKSKKNSNGNFFLDRLKLSKKFWMTKNVELNRVPANFYETYTL